jgi:hypothetical protein
MDLLHKRRDLTQYVRKVLVNLQEGGEGGGVE